MKITKWHKQILLEGGWLSDNLITAVQRLLKDQVLNVYGSHWITISNLLCSSGVVAVYDSKPDCMRSAIKQKDK